MKHECINLKSKLEFEGSYIKEIPREERIDYINQYAERIKTLYCRDLCPIGRFYRRYGVQNG